MKITVVGTIKLHHFTKAQTGDAFDLWGASRDKGDRTARLAWVAAELAKAHPSLTKAMALQDADALTAGVLAGF